MKKYDLKSRILALKNIQRKLREQRRAKKMETKLIFEAASASEEILKDLYVQLDSRHDEQLKLFLRQMLDITGPLLIMAEESEGRIPKPSSILKKTAAAFDRFKAGIDKNLSKEDTMYLRGVAGFVPLVDNVLYCCETLPYYFHHASTKGKIALVLSTVLSIISLAFVVAHFANIDLYKLPEFCMYATAGAKTNKEAYKFLIKHPERKYENSKILKETIKNLDAQVINIEKSLLNIYKIQPQKKVYKKSETKKYT